MNYCPHCKKPIPLLGIVRDFYTTTEAAAIAQVTAQTIINWSEADRFPSWRLGAGPRRINKAAFLTYLQGAGFDVREEVGAIRRAL